MKKKHKIYTLTIILLILGITPLIFAEQDYDYTCGMMNGAFGAYGTNFMVLTWMTYIAVIILAIAGTYWLIKSANKKK